MIGDSIILLILGMSIVFAFLTLLMYSVQGLSLVMQKFFPQPSAVAPVTKHSAPTSSKPSESTDQILTAVISAAINAFRQDSSR